MPTGRKGNKESQRGKGVEMVIPIDREKRIELLKWLKQGYIDGDTLAMWGDTKVKSMTDGQLQAEMARLHRCMYPDDCRRLKGLGLCVDYNRQHSISVCGVTLKKDSEEIPD